MRPGRARTICFGVLPQPLARWIGCVAPMCPTLGKWTLASCPFAALAACVCARPGELGACSPVRALSAVCVCCWWWCPPSPHLCFPSFFASVLVFFWVFCLFFFCFFFVLKWKRGRVHTAGTGMGKWCSGAVVLRSPVCLLGALSAAAPQVCSSRCLMYMDAGQGRFG